MRLSVYKMGEQYFVAPSNLRPEQAVEQRIGGLYNHHTTAVVAMSVWARDFAKIDRLRSRG